MTNTLNEYGFIECAEFEGLMPKVAEKVGTVGASEVSVHMHGFMAKGVDALEVIDIEKAFENSEENESTENDGTTEGEENTENNETVEGEENTENNETVEGEENTEMPS